MIYIKSKDEIELMRKANQLVKQTLDMLCDKVKAGMTTYSLDQMAYEFITRHNGTPSFLHFEGYPASVCISIEDEVVHGIPSKRRIIEEGTIVSFDCGAIVNGWQGDSARTVGIGNIDGARKQLIKVTEQCFFEAVKVIKAGVRIGDIGHAVQSYAEQFGYGVVRELTGHGIGRKMHEDPYVPNYGTAGKGIRLEAGTTIAIEPMINMGTRKVAMAPDGWTIFTQDGLPSSHYEHTVAITEDGVEILSL